MSLASCGTTAKSIISKDVSENWTWHLNLFKFDLALSNRITEILFGVSTAVWNANQRHIRNVSWQTYGVVSRRVFSPKISIKKIHEESINTDNPKCKEKFFIEPRLFLIFHAGVKRITSEENRGGRKHRRNRYASPDTQSKSGENFCSRRP